MHINELNNTAGIYKKEYVIKPEQADSSGKVSCGTLARFMQDMTTEHMQKNGLTVENMMAQNLLWVIVCTQININRLPETGETIEQYSWAGPEKFGMYSRKYAFFDKEGNELVNAASLFLIVNKETRTSGEATEDIKKLQTVTVADEPKLPKMAQRFPALIFGKEQMVKESEIDHNSHVNNAAYLDWADGIFDADFMKERVLTGVWAQYDKEIVSGQTVGLKYANAENEVYLKACVSGADCFKLKYDFK